MVMPVEQTKMYFHVASRLSSLRRWYITPAAQSVVASKQIHVTAMFDAKYTPDMAEHSSIRSWLNSLTSCIEPAEI